MDPNEQIVTRFLEGRIPRGVLEQIRCTAGLPEADRREIDEALAICGALDQGLSDLPAPGEPPAELLAELDRAALPKIRPPWAAEDWTVRFDGHRSGPDDAEELMNRFLEGAVDKSRLVAVLERSDLDAEIRSEIEELLRVDEGISTAFTAAGGEGRRRRPAGESVDSPEADPLRIDEWEEGRNHLKPRPGYFEGPSTPRDVLAAGKADVLDEERQGAAQPPESTGTSPVRDHHDGSGPENHPSPPDTHGPTD